ncbi:dTDP-4-dehydrorhamnose reductase [Sphingobacterium sp. DK4209]|uniref:dTDP-4-dehydrorhamnose reductase n=1 Tax=Sphingobacterium zhuxiongii TaxID=2662364 RepID=A0A5Q0QJ03_9SPHI|nr:dTDP-4-dehydrorhamnose reductase [Sphingobacterium sp. dk4302]MVZ65776.1 dTDP-4-dehydrorhamnose reductase [Sphingobacterium sp. DK4209]QGA27972.1 dTDP-4-dehydrorhamnose reductase [Sphingobacterium sp. dk4302]
MQENVKPLILITGATGQLGRELRVVFEDIENFQFEFVDRKNFPLDSVEQIQAKLKAYKPNCIINAAAYTAVDRAEEEFELANRVNHLAVKEMAIYSQATDCKFISISTDYVFDGEGNRAWVEEDIVKPINVYGETKALGERAILNENRNAIIIRTSWVYSTFGNNFVKTMLKLMSEREEIRVVDDQVGSPTYARDLAVAIKGIILSEKWIGGIYHYANEGCLSWFDFAKAIKKLANLSCSILPISSAEFPTVAKRPKFSWLDNSKIKSTFGIQIPKWETSLKKMLIEMGEINNNSI